MSTVTPTRITAAATAYLAGFDSRLEEAYGENWPAVALEIQRLCRER